MPGHREGCSQITGGRDCDCDYVQWNPPAPQETYITVCAACRTEECWKGVKRCDDWEGGTITTPIATPSGLKTQICEDAPQPDEDCRVCGMGTAIEVDGLMVCPKCKEPYYTHDQLKRRKPDECEKAFSAWLNSLAGKRTEMGILIAYRAGAKFERERLGPALELARLLSKQESGRGDHGHLSQRVVRALRKFERSTCGLDAARGV